MKLFLNLLVILSLLSSLSGVAAAQDDYQPPADQPGPAVEKLFFKAFNVDRAPLDLQAGEMDMYYYNLKIAAARELAADKNIKLYEAPASTLSLILNPAPAAEGEINPFALLPVRQALQKLIDREYIAREIYQGQGMPMYTPNSPTDFDYLTVYDIIQEAGLGYDPELARQEIADAMTEAGATLVDGVWNYEDRPVAIKFIIRVEDERREVGDLVRNALKEAGFQVEANYQPFAPAIQTVYSSDPKTFSWHLYTEGWGRGSAQRYDSGGINSSYAPWLGNLPGWQEVGFWQYENAKLDDLGKKIFRGEFQDKAARDEMYREMTQLGLDESVRIWIATVNNSYAMQQNVTGITQDLAAGPRGLWSLRSAYKPGSDELTIGHLWVWTERSTWNPVGGYSDVYSGDIARQLSDPPVINDPFTGIPQPFRADFNVETAGPTAKLTVPADAILWDAKGQRWAAVGEGIEATSKVTFDYARYFQSKWHHGQPISMADVVYSIYQGTDISYNPDKAKIETVIATTGRPVLETFKGYRIVDDHTIEVYVDFWHFEPNYIAAYATPSGVGTPWELLYTLDTLVFEQRRAAYSDTAAARYSVPWVSLVLDKDARLVRKAMLDLKNKATFPENVFDVPIGNGTPSVSESAAVTTTAEVTTTEEVTDTAAITDTAEVTGTANISETAPADDAASASSGGSLVDADSAVARYTATLDWFDQYGHLIISNGPFTLFRYDPPAQFAELHAYRDASYPFKASDFYKGIPEYVEFAETNAPVITVGEEYEASVKVTGPGTLAVRYLLSDAATGKIIAQGEAEAGSDDQFTVKLSADQTNELDLSLFKLVLVAYSDQLARMAERRVDIEASLLGEESSPAAAAATTTETVTATAAVTESVVSTDTAATESRGAVTETAAVTTTDTTTETAAAAPTDTPQAVAEPTQAEEPTKAAEAPAAEPAAAAGGSNLPLIGGVVVVALIAAFFLLRRRQG